MSTPANGHGHNRVLWWISGAILGPIVLAVFSNVVSTTNSNAVKVSALEAVLHEVRSDIANIHRKLDQLIERR
jgi:hypothetical protein